MSRTKLPVKCLDTPTHSLPAGIVIKPLNELLLCLDSSSTLRFYQTTFETIFQKLELSFWLTSGCLIIIQFQLCKEMDMSPRLESINLCKGLCKTFAPAHFTEHGLKKKRNFAKIILEHFIYCLGTTWKTSSPEQKTNLPPKKNKEKNEY